MSENFDFRGSVVMRVSTIPREGVTEFFGKMKNYITTV